MLASSYITPKAIKGHPSGIHGHGRVAVTPISKDEIAAIKGGHIVDTATVRSLPDFSTYLLRRITTGRH